VRAILDSVRHIVRALRLSHLEAERKVGLSAAQLFVLQTLKDGHVRSLRDIAAGTATDASSVSVVVARLVEAGLVRRRRSVHDGRQLELSLTARGRARLAAAPPSLAQQSLVDALETLTPGERQSLSGLLRRVVDGMGADHGTAEMFFETRPAARRARLAKRRKRDGS
jgi:DNA-binding MarR family transcriptional regulator